MAVITLELKYQGIDVGEDDKFYIREFDQTDLSDHNHNFFEFVYVKEGSGYHKVNGVLTKVKRGDYYIIDFGSIHSYSSSDNLVLINCLFLPELIDRTLKECHSFDQLVHVTLMKYYKLYMNQTSVNQVFHDTDSRVKQAIEILLLEYGMKAFGYMDIIRGTLLELMIIAMRNIVDESHIESTNTVVNDAILFIKEHYIEKNVLERYCKEYHFTQQYVSRKFKEETGFGFHNYIQKLRIETSCKLLASTDLPIGEIGSMVGYEDTKYFVEVFKRLLHMSPRGYKKLTNHKVIDKI